MITILCRASDIVYLTGNKSPIMQVKYGNLHALKEDFLYKLGRDGKWIASVFLSMAISCL